MVGTTLGIFMKISTLYVRILSKIYSKSSYSDSKVEQLNSFFVLVTDILLDALIKGT